MAYTKTTWGVGDIITSEKMNNIEEGITAADKAVLISGVPPTDSDNKIWVKRRQATQNIEIPTKAEVDNLVTVSETEPQSEDNKIWVKGTGTSVLVPTMTDLGTVKHVIAEEYRTDKSYKVGDYVYHDAGFYKCNTIITNGEEWDYRKWD